MGTSLLVSDVPFSTGGADYNGGVDVTSNSSKGKERDDAAGVEGWETASVIAAKAVGDDSVPSRSAIALFTGGGNDSGGGGDSSGHKVAAHSGNDVLLGAARYSERGKLAHSHNGEVGQGVLGGEKRGHLAVGASFTDISPLTLPEKSSSSPSIHSSLFSESVSSADRGKTKWGAALASPAALLSRHTQSAALSSAVDHSLSRHAASTDRDRSAHARVASNGSKQLTLPSDQGMAQLPLASAVAYPHRMAQLSSAGAGVW